MSVMFILSFSCILVPALRNVGIFQTISLSSCRLSLGFPFLKSCFSFTPFYSICLVVYQLSKSVRLLFANEVSALLSDLVARSTRLWVLGTWGTIWRWPLTPIKGCTTLLGSYQFNQLTCSLSLAIHGAACVPRCLPCRRTYSPAWSVARMHENFLHVKG